MNGPNWNLDGDLKTVTVTFPTDPPVALKLDARRLGELLQNLGEFRAHMKPEVPRDYALGQKVAVIQDPRWETEPDALIGNSLLHIRDPRFGWLHYMIPREQARKLVGILQAQVDAPPPGQSQGKVH